MNLDLKIILPVVIAFCISVVLCPIVIPFLKKLKFGQFVRDDGPQAHLKKAGTPTMGGLIILLSFTITTLIYMKDYPDVLPVLFVTLGFGLIGFIDDYIKVVMKRSMGLRAWQKMLGQIVAACVVACSGLLFSSIHNPFGEGYIEFGWVAYPLTVFYLVAFANVINLIDGLDGLAAGITGISAITILLFAVLTGRFDAALFGVILVGVCAGFLKSNFFPASIFMGDSGALLLGFALGIISLFAVARSALFVSLLVPILAAGVPILDTFFAIVRRKREHRPIDEADKGHIHHRLMRAGFSQRATVLIMWAWTALLAACGVIITWADNLVRIPIFLIACAVTAYAIVKLRLLGDALSHHFNPRRKPERGEPQEPKQDQ